MATRTTMELGRLHASADEAAAMMRSLGNADRLLLLCELAQAERSVSELAELTGIVQPTLSQQLGVLREQGLVATRREGKFIHYSVDDPRVVALLKTLYNLYCRKD